MKIGRKIGRKIARKIGRKIGSISNGINVRSAVTVTV
jgi:hypothetical protein